VRVLLVNAHGADSTYGGAERYTGDLARMLRDRGHDAFVLSAFPSRGPLDVPSLALHRSDWRTDPARRVRNRAGDFAAMPWPRLERAVAAAAPDVVHTGNLPGLGTGVWEAARRLAVPVVHTLHDYYLLCARTSLVRSDGRACTPHPALCGLRSRRLARWSSAVSQVVAGSAHLHDRHRSFFPDAETRVIRLPLVATEALPQPPAAPPRTLGYIGALEQTKGIRELLAAAPALADEGLAVRIAGDGRLRAEVEAAAGRGEIVYEGRVEGEAKQRFLAGCDAGLVPSTWEEPSGPPYVVCEWLSAGRPVLVSDRGGLAEAVALGGVAVAEPAADGLVAAGRRLHVEEEWRRLRDAVPAVAGTDDLERWVDEHLSVYEAAAA
jgi:glycosyltransferase involved in cell wall biosynthesis